MEGVLFKWGPNGVNVAFRSPLGSSLRRHVVLIGGLTDGLLPTSYTMPLARALSAEGWGLVQPLLTSSYIGYGTSSLEQDAEEVDGLLGFIGSELQASTVVLAGHSTGCQDIVHYLGRTASTQRGLVKGAILQGSCSDREFLATLPDTNKWVALAQDMARQGKAQELMPRSANEMAPITAERFLSLADKGGPDDLFSSDFSDDELAQKLGHMKGTKTLVLFSDKDEYVPDHVDKALLVRRLSKAMGGAQGVLIEDGDHSLKSGQEEAIGVIMKFMKSIE